MLNFAHRRKAGGVSAGGRDNAADLQAKLNVFQDWHDRIRPHQHLLGQTPLERWHGVDYRKRMVKSWKKYEAWEGRLVGYVLRC